MKNAADSITHLPWAQCSLLPTIWMGIQYGFFSDNGIAFLPGLPGSLEQIVMLIALAKLFPGIDDGLFPIFFSVLTSLPKRMYFNMDYFKILLSHSWNTNSIFWCPHSLGKVTEQIPSMAVSLKGQFAVIEMSMYSFSPAPSVHSCL